MNKVPSISYQGDKNDEFGKHKVLSNVLIIKSQFEILIAFINASNDGIDTDLI